MDLDIIQSTKEGEIAQFLCDARDYFKAALATSEYENTSNMFYLTAEDATQQLLHRCEQLLNRLGNKRQNTSLPNTKTVTNGLDSHQWYQNHKDNMKKQQQQQRHHPLSSSSTAINGSPQTQLDQQQQEHMAQQNSSHQPEDVSYLDMSAANNSQKRSLPSKESLDKMSTSIESDKTFRCSTLIVQQNKSFLHRLQESMAVATDEVFDENDSLGGQLDGEFKDDSQIYDICQVTTQGSDGEEDELALEETEKAITSESHLSLPNIGCPFMDLPAGHLSIHKSTKYGQLQKIEKRLFFDQSKKCYCGIINDWLLCYAEGPTSNRPSNTLYLKMPGVEIEHFGEGKRRDICFQVSTPDPNKRFVFQAVNEIDAKEWIHAIEAAIRGGITGTGAKTTTIATRSSASRKLPTPPVMKKITFLSTFQKGKDIRSPSNALTTSLSSSDCIYEEPSPVYHAQEQSNEEEIAIRPVLPLKQNSPMAMAHRFEYDVPKCPPQPLINQNQDVTLINPYDIEKEQPTNEAPLESQHPSLNLIFDTTTKGTQKSEENSEFQAKIKDVHIKLSSQLSNGPNPKKTLKKTYSSASSNTDGELLILSTSPITSPSTADLKKHKKSSTPQSSPQKPTDKGSATKNWFLNRLNKTTSSARSNGFHTSPQNTPAKCKQSEKENLLNTLDNCDGFDNNDSSLSSNPASPILKSSASSMPINSKSKVNMIINQLEASGHLPSIFSADSASKFCSFGDNDCNNYEPIMTISSPPNSFMKKV